jgi:hypothetical protein
MGYSLRTPSASWKPSAQGAGNGEVPNSASMRARSNALMCLPGQSRCHLPKSKVVRASVMRDQFLAGEARSGSPSPT